MFLVFLTPCIICIEVWCLVHDTCLSRMTLKVKLAGLTLVTDGERDHMIKLSQRFTRGFQLAVQELKLSEDASWT